MPNAIDIQLTKAVCCWNVCSRFAAGERSAAWQNVARFWEVVRGSPPTRYKLLSCAPLWSWISPEDIVTCRSDYIIFQLYWCVEFFFLERVVVFYCTIVEGHWTMSFSMMWNSAFTVSITHSLVSWFCSEMVLGKNAWNFISVAALPQTWGSLQHSPDC